MYMNLFKKSEVCKPAEKYLNETVLFLDFAAQTVLPDDLMCTRLEEQWPLIKVV